jgi:hypothetical protein
LITVGKFCHPAEFLSLVLIMRGSEEALQILADLHGKGDRSNGLVVLEFEQIKEQVDFERNEGAKSY